MYSSMLIYGNHYISIKNNAECNDMSVLGKVRRITFACQVFAKQ